ncbi:MAG: hypothetical protein R3F47_18980 [Gammaproteobacteria bacterium]
MEIDTERSRLIATDTSGTATDMRFSGMGFLAGAIIGNLLGRQRLRHQLQQLRQPQCHPAQQLQQRRAESFSGSHSFGK